MSAQDKLAVAERRLREISSALRKLDKKIDHARERAEQPEEEAKETIDLKAGNEAELPERIGKALRAKRSRPGRVRATNGAR